MMENKHRKISIIDRFFQSIQIEKIFFSALLATIFTAGLCFNMLSLSYKYLESQVGKPFYVDFEWVFWVGIIISLFYLYRECVIRMHPAKFDFALAILCQTLIFIAIISYHNEEYANVAYSWILPIAYIVGKAVVGKDEVEANKRITVIVYTLMFAVFIASMLDFYTFFKYSKLYGYYLTEGWPGFWSDAMQNRCGMSLGLFLVNSSLWFALKRRKQQPIMAAAIVILLLVSLYWGKMVQSRTIILLPVLSLIIVLMITSYDNRKIIPLWFWIVLMAVILTIVGGLYLAVSNNWFGLKEIYKTSQWGEELFHNQRFVRAWNGFKLMLQNPYGKLIEPVNVMDNPHNTFLQYGRVNGIAVFVLLELFRIVTLKDAIKMAINTKKHSWIKYLLIPAFVCFNINFSMDPNGYTQKEFLMILLIINGMIRGWNEIEEAGNNKYYGY